MTSDFKQMCDEATANIVAAAAKLREEITGIPRPASSFSDYEWELLRQAVRVFLANVEAEDVEVLQSADLNDVSQDWLNRQMRKIEDDLRQLRDKMDSHGGVLS